MKKIILIIFITFITFNIFSNRFWNNDKNYKQILTVESIISYSPSVVNYVYGNYDVWLINKNNQFGYYFSDCVQWTHMFNIYPIFQFGVIFNYRWLWGLQTFVFSNLYRVLGFNFDVYNLTFQLAIGDIGFSWFKYEWNKSINNRNNQTCLLFSPITVGFSYRIGLNDMSDIFINIGYSMQMIINNQIYFPNSNVDASMFLEHSFNSGIGFRFYTRSFK